MRSLFLFFVCFLSLQKVSTFRIFHFWMFGNQIRSLQIQVMFVTQVVGVLKGAIKNLQFLVQQKALIFFELSSDNKLNFIDFIPGRYVSSQAITREYKTYRQYAYAVGDEGLSSLQIIDLSYLPDSVHLVNDLQNNFLEKHTIFLLIRQMHCFIYVL